MNEYASSDFCHLTLTKISESQAEMSYIARMRNVIQFQIESSADYEYVKQEFIHLVLFNPERKEQIGIILCHALSIIAKSHVLLHNYQHFLQWETIMINENDFLLNQNQSEENEEIIPLANANISRKLFLIVTFTDLLNCFVEMKSNIPARQYRKQQFSNSHLDRLAFNNPTSNLDTMYDESTWRRLYANPCTVLCCRDEDIILYKKEQTQEKREINVFKKIMERQTGELLNIFHVLKSIASPYYYILPHTHELLDSRRNDYLNLMSICFVSKLNIIVKNKV
ncbi:uncharacterized protein TNCT_513891 [Trichonephila clavata]|uniref:Uncharacterized protein n=1 Tax=Trichonephila clavata TaxID=2740835 RepID=A0A8X6G367_TRICU|nr:uncharacterized protein TNCT_513891 [Trichonephila clavata]